MKQDILWEQVSSEVYQAEVGEWRLFVAGGLSKEYDPAKDAVSTEQVWIYRGYICRIKKLKIDIQGHEQSMEEAKNKIESLVGILMEQTG